MNDKVRVRFAPSPTGYLHIGGLRTALFNYLFARHNGGKFILRIEDTDQTRKVEGAVENLINTFRIMDIDYDEGPDKGGDFGPYFQSQRLGIYKKHSDDMLRSGNSYRCFCTPERLEKIRAEQKKRGETAQYDRLCRNLNEGEIKKKLNEGLPYVIRLKVPLNEEIIFDDIIRGSITIDTNQVDDQVLIKSDGYPTYHFAHVIDDHLMEISHVIRGEEWLTSVPKHILVYRAFGWDVPKLAHVPLIVNPDKTKLSKRQGDVATEDFLKKGYLKEALLNYIALLGWKQGESETQDIFSKDELIAKFTLDRISPANAVFDLDKLKWMNAEYIKSFEPDTLAELAKPFLIQAGYDVGDINKLMRVMIALRTYIQKLDEIPEQAKRYFIHNTCLNNEQKSIINSDSSVKVLGELNEKLSKLNDITLHNFKPVIVSIQKDTGIKGKELFQPIRLALTGEDHGPELGLIAFVLGKEEVLRRISTYF
jgi:glutamyl-tRNA synthetase